MGANLCDVGLACGANVSDAGHVIYLHGRLESAREQRKRAAAGTPERDTERANKRETSN